MFSENFIRLQNEKRVTNYRISKDLNVHASTVANWKLGVVPQLASAIKIADYFGVTVNDLLK